MNDWHDASADTQRRHLTVYLPDTRDVEISRYGRGNLKIGLSVYTYSRPAGDPRRHEFGTSSGTCPGSSDECEAICYAKRITGPVFEVYQRNVGDDVPPIPLDCRLLRIHVSGDFDTTTYVENWMARLLERPDVTCWIYTRSWRVPALLPSLERLRALPNVQVFASMDTSVTDMPPAGWRVAWIDGDPRLLGHLYSAHHQVIDRDWGGGVSYICPEETGRKRDCEACRYCFDGRRGDVTFLRH